MNKIASLGACACLFCVPAVWADCAVDLVGTWNVTHTSEKAGAPRVKEDMPVQFSFARDGSMRMLMGFMDEQSPYSCSGRTITVHKTVPSVLQIIATGSREIAWVEQGESRIFYLKRS